MAVELDPTRQDGWLLKGLLELVNRDFAGAEQSLEKLKGMALPGGKLHKQAKTYASWASQCRKYVAKHGQAEDEKLNQALAKAFAGLEETLVAARFYQEGEVSAAQEREVLEVRLAAAVEGLVRNNPGLKKEDVEYGVTADGAFLECRSKALFDIAPLAGTPLTTVDLSRTEVRDIAALKGMPLTTLSLARTRVEDLAPLEGMPLASLNLWTTRVSDITALKGAPLSCLSLADTKVRDISALAGAPLTELFLLNTPVSDVSAIRGMPLERLTLSRHVTDISVLAGMPLTRLCIRSAVSDIGVLRGMPLEELDLYTCKTLRDFSPLSGCRTLKKLLVPPRCEALEVLRELPNLKVIEDTAILTQARQPAAEFWRKWDAEKAKRE